MKKILCCILSVLLMTSLLAYPAHAASNNSNSYCGTINLESLISNPNVEVSDVMSFSEVVERYAKNAGITYEEALKILPAPAQAYSARAVNYRTYSVSLKVNDEYIPRLEFYCETAEGGHFFNILSIYSVQLVRSYNGTSYQFGGDIEVWLRSSHSIEYVVNGDFYYNGTTTSTGSTGLDVGLSDSCKISYSASNTYSSNHYDYFYEHDTLQVGGT